MVQAQYARVRMDTVVACQPGSGQNTGQSPLFFPANVLRGPAPEANDTVPSLDSREICSIGLGGTIVLGLKDHVIVDGPGVDIVVFENAFIGPLKKVFAEPAQVSVSKDGLSWMSFPFDSLTLEGCAGRTPTFGGDPFAWPSSGGDGFDLATVGVDSVRYVRLHDVTGIIKNNSHHPYFDPSLTGFDLDVITIPHATLVATNTDLGVEPRTTNVLASVVSGKGIVRVYNVYGTLLHEEEVGAGVTVIPLGRLGNSCLLVTMVSNENVVMVKVLQ